MWVLNLGQPIKVPPLTETMAIELGANLLGECVIFSIGAAALVFEYLRQAKKDAKKEELIEQEKKELIHTLNDFALQLERQETQMREMSRVIADLGAFWSSFQPSFNVIQPFFFHVLQNRGIGCLAYPN